MTNANASPSPTDAMSVVLAQNWWLVALRGLFGIVFGLFAILFPGATMLSLVIVFAAYLLVDGIVGIAAAVMAARQHDRWGWLTFEGIVNIVVAVLAVVWPGLTILAFVLLMAVWSIMSGAFMTAAAFRLRLDHGRWWLVLGGLLSIAFGILLVIAPLAGALVLTWWVGTYALVFGVLLLIFAFRLRGMRGTGTTAT